MPTDLLGVVADSMKDWVGYIALTVLGLAAIAHGSIGCKNRRVVIRGTEYGGISAQAWGMVLIVLGLGFACWGVAGIGTLMSG